jgi:hypothetical protein
MTASRALSIRRRGCSSDGKKLPVRSLDAQLEPADAGVEQAVAVAVALRQPALRRSFAVLSADDLGHLDLDQSLHGVLENQTQGVGVSTGELVKERPLCDPGVGHLSLLVEVERATKRTSRWPSSSTPPLRSYTT